MASDDFHKFLEEVGILSYEYADMPASAKARIVEAYLTWKKMRQDERAEYFREVKRAEQQAK